MSSADMLAISNKSDESHSIEIKDIEFRFGLVVTREASFICRKQVSRAYIGGQGRVMK